MQSHEVVADRPVGIPTYSWYALALLTSVYVLNFIDRQLIFILFGPIQKEMKFTDLQLALLGTTAFVIFYTLLGVPFGRLADRTSRKVLIGSGLAVWSIFSGLTGFADSFWSLFFCRLMVGVGEATLGPAALSLLSDYFPPRMRATTQSIYSTGIALGGGLSFFLGGWIATEMGWRWAFYLLGFPGVILAVLVFALREPPRGRTESAVALQQPADWKALFRSVPLRYLFTGYALIGLASNQIGTWMSIFYMRIYDLSLLTIATASGIIALVIGIPAMILGGYFSDRMSRRLPGGRLAFTAIIALACVPLWIGVLMSKQLAVVVTLNIVLYALAILWVGPATADVHDLAGPQHRGLAVGILFSAVYIAAYLIGAPLVGKLSDILGVATNPEKMRLSLMVCPVACALGAGLLWMGSRARARAALAGN
jgi:MFS family permease